MGQITLEEQTAPGTPATDKVVVYPKAGGGLYKKNDAGVETSLSGTVDISGTPVDNDYAKFTDADTIEGRSYSEVRTDLNIEDGADVTDATNVNAAGAVMESDFNAKGDLLSASANDTPVILGVGANTHVLTANSAQASGLEWVAPGAPGAHKDSHDPQDGSDALDTASPSELVGVQASGAGSSHSLARADHAHQIQHSIADNHLVTIDSTTNQPVNTDYAAWTASGLEGRDKTQMLTFLNVADGADVTGSNAPQAHKDLHDPADGGDALDTANAAEISVVVAAGTGTSHSLARADHVHAINHAITDNHIVTIDGTTNTPVTTDYAKWTANGLEGKAYSEVMADLSGQAAADFSMNTHKITAVVDPTADQHVATKKYVDDNSINNIVEDTSPQLGGDLEYNEKNMVFDITMTADNTASGDIITVTYGESVVFGDLVYADGPADEFMKGLATNAAVKHPVVGVALETKANAESGKMLLRGLVRDATHFSGFAMGDILYLSDGTAGAWLNAAPTTSGDIVQIVGFVVAANYAFFNPDYTYVEIA